MGAELPARVGGEAQLARQPGVQPGPLEVEAAAEIEVADSGMGIGDIDPSKIFERLYRSGSAVAQQVPGAGLGLTIALAIVEAHHGTIGVVKSDSHGTTFRMSFPLIG